MLAWNPSTQEGEAGRQRLGGCTEIHTKNLSQKKNEKNEMRCEEDGAAGKDASCVSWGCKFEPWNPGKKSEAVVSPQSSEVHLSRVEGESGHPKVVLWLLQVHRGIHITHTSSTLWSRDIDYFHFWLLRIKLLWTKLSQCLCVWVCAQECYSLGKTPSWKKKHNTHSLI